MFWVSLLKIGVKLHFQFFQGVFAERFFFKVVSSFNTPNWNTPRSNLYPAISRASFHSSRTGDWLGCAISGCVVPFLGFLFSQVEGLNFCFPRLRVYQFLHCQ